MFFVFFLLALAQAAPTTPVLQCDKFVTLKTGSDFDLPPQSVPKGVTCRNDFTLPSDVYGYGYIQLTGMLSDDVVTIRSKYDTVAIVHRSDVVNTTLTFPSSFSVTIQNANNANLQVSMHVSLYKATPTANIVKSYVTFDGSASVFLYNNEWKEGESYKFTSKVANIAINTAVDPFAFFDDSVQLNNVLVYDRGTLMGTLYHVMKNRGYVSVTSEIILYKVKPTTMSFEGATLVTDYANIFPLTNYDVTYLAHVGDSNDFNIASVNNKTTALTIVGAHDGSTAVDIQSFTLRKGNGQLSYASGGPQPKSASKPLANLPAHVTGYANTVYMIGGGAGTMTVKTTKK